VEMKTIGIGMGVLVFVDVMETTCVERGGTTDDTVDVVAFGEEELGEVGTVLTSDSGDEGDFTLVVLFWRGKRDVSDGVCHLMDG
jgi:hypothetical protein